MREAWIIEGLRSPRGGGKPGVGSMSHIHPQRILAQVLNALKDRVGFDPKDVEDVVMGTGSGVGAVPSRKSKSQPSFAWRMWREKSAP